jgi:hypothetical protein
VNTTEEYILSKKNDMVNPASNTGYYGTPYPFGVDPVWQLAENRFTILPFCHFTRFFTISHM